MMTLAGYKIRAFREAQVPKLTRDGFGARFGAPARTVLGWEDSGKRPRDAMLNAIVASGVVTHADWFRPARCTRCERVADDIGLAACELAKCPFVTAAAGAAA